jgi:hypothetical protein
MEQISASVRPTSVVPLPSDRRPTPEPGAAVETAAVVAGADDGMGVTGTDGAGAGTGADTTGAGLDLTGCR